ncbi:unnamed protein product [Closterium sp. Yama58-4]|nr:unnamed protein product [Closterium sp. Yama58-4]
MLTPLTIRCINVNGINKQKKINDLRGWHNKRDPKADILILIDTRLTLNFHRLILTLKPSSYAYCPSPYLNRSKPGGIAVLIFHSQISISSQEPSPDGRILSLHINFLGEQLRLIAVYAPSTPFLRRPWWRTLFSSALDSPTSSAGTIVAGDFNAVCSAEDRNRPPLAHETSEGLILSAALQRHSLVDSFRISYPNKPMFSFFALPRALPEVPPPTASRLDRIYVSSSLSSRVLDAQYASASQELTDHDLSPSCVLSCEAPNLAPRPWRLPHALLQRPHTAQIVSTACLDLPSDIHGEAWDAWKLSLCNKLKAFGRQEKIRIKKTSDHLQNLVSHLRIALAVNPTDSALSEHLRAVSQQFDRYEASCASDIALKAKLKSPAGELVSELPAMSELCTSYFRELYSASQPVRPDDKFWSHLPPSQVPPNIAHRLSQPFSMAEISAAINKLPRGKTPGPDGLPGELFRSFRTKFSPAIHSLFLSSPSALPPPMIQGRTVLIPKKGDATVLDNLRPITLMNSDYKILAICLALRLQPLLPSLIHHSQAAFIKSRKIGDTLNDTLDIFDWATTQNLPLLALTVDIRKAYDLVDCEFMLSCLAFLGLPPPFLHWVRLMHTGTTTRISVNNLCGPAIPVRSGVRQGCPLAPLLFLCAIEIFHRYSSHFLPGFPISRTQGRLMACYADDVTIFLNSDKELQTASHVLLSFAAVSGEHPNWAKCAILPFNIPPATVTYAGTIPIRGESEFERILGIHVGLSGRSETRLSGTCSPSKYRAEGRTTRLLTHSTIYNKVEHGGIGAIRPSTQILALNAQRALRRFSHLPNAAVARELVPIPFGLHGFLLHEDFPPALPDSVPARLREEVKALAKLNLTILPPRPEFWCILAEPVPYNRFLLKSDERPFGRLKDEVFLLTEEVRIGHIVRRDATGARRMTEAEIMLKYPPRVYPCSRRILNEVYDAMPDEWWAALSSSHCLVPLSPGDWVLRAADMHAPPPPRLRSRSRST